MMNFAIKMEKCLGCKAPLQSNKKTGTAMCRNCIENEQQIYVSKLNAANDLANQFSRLWTTCQNCQGSLHQEVLCTSKDCPIFYKRVKVQKDLEEAHQTLSRFQSIEW